MAKKSNDIVDIVAIGSIIGNIMQAFKQAENSQDIEKLKSVLRNAIVEKNYLKRQIGNWQRAYTDLKSKADKLIKDNNGIIVTLRNELNKMEKKLYQKDKELENLKNKINELKTKE